MALPITNAYSAGGIAGTLLSYAGGTQASIMGLQTDLARKSFSATIMRLMPNGTATLFGLTSMLGDEIALQYEHGYFAKTMIFPSFTLNAAPGSATTAVPMSTQDTLACAANGTNNLVPGMVMQVMNTTGVPTGEVVIIETVNSGTGITVSRNASNQGSGTLTVALASGMTLYQIGSAYAEASNRPAALGIMPVRLSNYTQIFRNTWTISDSVRATQVAAGDSTVAESRQDCMAFHATDIEKAIIFGQKALGYSNGGVNGTQPRRMMDGLISIIGQLSNYPSSYAAANVTTITTGSLSGANISTAFATLETALDPVFNQASDPKHANERLMFVGGASKRILNNIGKASGTIWLQTQETAWGLQFSEFHTARGNFKIIEHPLFNSNPMWAKAALVVDPAAIKLAYLGDRKTQNREFNVNMRDLDPVDSGIDAVGGTLTTEVTLLCKNPPACAMLWNMS